MKLAYQYPDCTNIENFKQACSFARDQIQNLPPILSLMQESVKALQSEMVTVHDIDTIVFDYTDTDPREILEIKGKNYEFLKEAYNRLRKNPFLLTL